MQAQHEGTARGIPHGAPGEGREGTWDRAPGLKAGKRRSTAHTYILIRSALWARRITRIAPRGLFRAPVGGDHNIFGQRSVYCLDSVPAQSTMHSRLLDLHSILVQCPASRRSATRPCGLGSRGQPPCFIEFTCAAPYIHAVYVCSISMYVLSAPSS